MTSSDRKSKNQNKLMRKIIKYSLIIFLSLFILAFLIGSGLFIHYATTAPKLDVSKLESKPSSIVYDKDGNIIADLGQEKREMVATNEIPLTLVDAITSIEDHRFFNHRGVDPVRIMGSVLHNAKSDTTQGGSTLTQQLIKLSYFSTNKSDQNVKRKAQEAWLSVQLERKASKEEILTFYINKVYMANGYYGMRTAAKAYYGKELKDLSLSQLALLAGMPQSPNGYNPYTNPEAAKTRRNTVLSSMLQYEKISKDDYDKAVAAPIDEGLQKLSPSITIPAYADNFLKQVIEQVKNDTGQDVTTGGLKVYTTLDTNAQKYLYDIVNSDEYVSYPDNDMQVASTVVDVSTGAVAAQIGARKQDPGTIFGNNQAVNTDRDWGSTMKPITDYAPAYEYGVYDSTGKYLSDNPYNYPGTDIPLYNWDHKYQGQITVRRAITQSRNVPAVKTLESVGLDNSAEFLNKLNIKYQTMGYPNGISSNTNESGREWGASSEKMASAYAAFASGGIYTKPYYVTKIIDDEGKETNLKPEKIRAMKETTAYMMTDMLKDVITQGTMTNGYIPGLIQAGKTGTSNYTDEQFEQVVAEYGMLDNLMAPDENFVGYTPHYSMAVWTGYKNKLNPLYGPKLAVSLDVYREMMTYLSQNVPNEDWVMPEGVHRNGSELTVSN
ncbi:PBP1A family penicillin-binding protein [Floricoccus penangensis]|uniref:PBP1A family penicillin-binding protein n=1 Tax=Floricoccus penangensis TaxID=1859475 RepID=UPI00203F4582|nr:PBP1A family penicillin-binding protein [Floricoccus penangensis]URZ86697.1 PBP1A family penicillin-binding protein [Floricoccus penangensis]